MYSLSCRVISHSKQHSILLLWLPSSSYSGLVNQQSAIVEPWNCIFPVPGHGSVVRWLGKSSHRIRIYFIPFWLFLNVANEYLLLREQTSTLTAVYRSIGVRTLCTESNKFASICPYAKHASNLAPSGTSPKDGMFTIIGQNTPLAGFQMSPKRAYVNGTNLEHVQ